MNKPTTYEYAAKEFLKQYAKENGIKDICELFDKEILVEFVYQSDWDWAIKDEMETNGLSEKEAIEESTNWFMSMDKHELFYERTSTNSQYCLITSKAEDLGFEWEE